MKDKELKEIEQLLSTSKVEVPEGLEARMGELVDALAAKDKILARANDVVAPVKDASRTRSKKGRIWIWSLSAGMAAALAIFLGLNHQTQPADTFSSPALAYAEVERALQKISDKATIAYEQMEMAETMIEKQMKIFK